MTQNFFLRLRQYYEKVGAVLRGEAEAASVFPNSRSPRIATPSTTPANGETKLKPIITLGEYRRIK